MSAAICAYLLFATGCSGGPEAMCDDACDCAGGGCDDDDKSDCVARLERAEDDAEERDCSDQIDDLYDCWEGEFECRGEGDFDYSSCADEERRFSQCMGSYFLDFGGFG
ncbi:MAG: hypothetical protein AAGA56_20460 [Myxococcota bacterium]